MPVGDTTVDILKSTTDIHISGITNVITLSFEKVSFPDDDLKCKDITSIIKKKGDLKKGWS